MTDTINGAVRLHRNGRTEPSECRCPACASIISPDLLASIIGAENLRRLEVEQAVEARFAKQIAEAERKKKSEITAAVRDATRVAETKLAAIRANQAGVVAAAVAAEREKVAKATDQAVNAATEKHVKENLRLAAMVNELTRALEKKSINALGDELELDLLALLQSEPEFADDIWERVGKGVPGPDIIQTVVSNGVPVGRIVFDAKNTKKWSGTWTRKLHQDALALEAEHAVLVVAATAFPSGNHGLLYRDSVLVTSGARLLPIVSLMRKQAIQSYSLKLTNQQRGEKADKLLLMLTSNRVADLWQRHREGVSGLLESERLDAVWLEKSRTRRSELINGLRTIVDQEFLAGVDSILNGGSWEASV